MTAVQDCEVRAKLALLAQSPKVKITVSWNEMICCSGVDTLPFLCLEDCCINIHNSNSLKSDTEIALINGSLKNILLLSRYCHSRISDSNMNATMSFEYMPLT